MTLNSKKNVGFLEPTIQVKVDENPELNPIKSVH